MQRDPRVYLADILEACDAISAALTGMQIDDYLSHRLVRSLVEREFTIIGEAVLALSYRAPDIFASITNARRIADFRNQPTHEYPTVDDGGFGRSRSSIDRFSEKNALTWFRSSIPPTNIKIQRMGARMLVQCTMALPAAVLGVRPT